MKLAVVAAGYTPGEADQLRRYGRVAPSGRIEAHRERLITRMIQRGISSDFAERLFAQDPGLWGVWLPREPRRLVRAHRLRHRLSARSSPGEFHRRAAQTPNPWGFIRPPPSSRTRSVEASRFAQSVCAAVNGTTPSSETNPTPPGRSAWVSGRCRGSASRERASLERLTAPPRDLEEFVSRSGLSRRALLSLAEAGAFASLDVNRRDANWQPRGILRRLGDRLLHAHRGGRDRLPSALSRRRDCLGLSSQRTQHPRASHAARARAPVSARRP